MPMTRHMDPALFPANDYDRERLISVLHVSDFASSYPGAFVRQLLELDAQLASQRDEACAFAFPERAKDTEWFKQLRAKRYPVYTVSDSNSLRDGKAVKAIAKVIADVGAPIVHSHFGTYDRAVVRAAESLPVKPQVLWHYRTALEVPVHKRGIVRRAKDWLRYSRYRDRIDGCIAISKGVCEEAQARGLRGKVRLVVPGIDLAENCFNETARHRVRRELGIPAGEVVVLHLGWHWRRKGGDLLANALAQLEEVGVQNVSAFSVGAPDNVDTGLVHRLAPRDKVTEYYAAADIFVSASRSEAWGNGLAEAMACERVAIGPLVDGQSEVFLGAAGCMPVPPDDSLSLAAAIGRLIECRDDWAELGKANREHIVQRFDVARWAGDMAAVYNEMLESVSHTFISHGEKGATDLAGSEKAA